MLLAAAYAAATEALTRRGERPELSPSIALVGHRGRLASLALALTFALDKGWLTIALALVSLGTAWLVGAAADPVPALACGRSSPPSWCCASARSRASPAMRVGTTPIFNWLLWGYGVPALSFWGAAISLRRSADDVLRCGWSESAAILFTVLLAFMEIRHAVNGGDVYYIAAPGSTEVALQVCVTLAMAIGLERLRLRSGSIVHNVGAVLLTAVRRARQRCSGCSAWRTRCMWRIDVGGGFFNLLLLGYALPAVLALLLSYAVAGHRPASLRQHHRGRSRSILALAYVTLRNPQALSRTGAGADDATTDAEQYTYSIAWLMFGVVLLGIGIVVNSQRARLASAAVDRPDDPEGVPGRHVDADRRLSRAVVHVPRHRAGRHRLAVSAHPVPAGARPRRRHSGSSGRKQAARARRARRQGRGASIGSGSDLTSMVEPSAKASIAGLRGSDST